MLLTIDKTLSTLNSKIILINWSKIFVGFKSIREIDEHVTEVGGDGKRNVWTILLQK